MHAAATVRGMPTISPLPDALREELRLRVDREGAAKVSLSISVPLGTLTRALSGLPLRNGTIALIRIGLADAPRTATA